MTKSIDIYLVSSTLHFFWAFMLAKRFQDQRDSHLILIDQYANRPMQLWSYLTPENTPFISQTKLEGRELGGFKKLRNRYKQFNWVSDFIKNNDVNRVWIGNDRSVLGQWFIKEAKQKSPSCVACFMDDGVFSYLGRSASQSFSERYLDSTFKKIIYGFWYDSPLTVGASQWIDEAWVMYPSYINKALTAKKTVEIYPNNNGFHFMEEFSIKFLTDVGVSCRDLDELDVLITLPNHSVFKEIVGYQEALFIFVEKLKLKGLKVGVKYHPAMGKKDPLHLQASDLWVLPSQISFEVLIPFLKNCTIVGDMSTTVLLANYVETLDHVKMINLKNEPNLKKMADLCKRLSINVVELNTLSD